jgi:dTDP-4-dehydrorhamnose 3,5-epimerase
VFDVAVDIRRSSPTFGQWIAVELSAENHTMLWVPEGFAHGYLTLSDHTDVVYKSTAFWAPLLERSILWNDAHLGISWPFSDDVRPMLSTKDAQAPRFAMAECFK